MGQTVRREQIAWPCSAVSSAQIVSSWIYFKFGCNCATPRVQEVDKPPVDARIKLSVSGCDPVI